MIEENVKVVAGNGEVCFVCESEIARSSPAIEVAFNVNLVIAKKRMTELMHLNCAKRLRSILDLRIQQAEKAWGRA
jgi:hypothetical protein